MAKFKHYKKKYTKLDVIGLEIRFVFHDNSMVSAYAEVEGQSFGGGIGMSKEEALFDFMVKKFGVEDE